MRWSDDLLRGLTDVSDAGLAGRAAAAFDGCRAYASRVIPVAVEEMLRWVSPVKNMNRTLTRDTELRGQMLRKGDNALLLYPSANRAEDVFADPFRFDIARWPNEYLAFGLGSHFCLGNSLARLEWQVMFERLLDRLPDMEPAQHAEPAFRPANFISGYESLPVRFTSRPALGRP